MKKNKLKFKVGKDKDYSYSCIMDISDDEIGAEMAVECIADGETAEEISKNSIIAKYDWSPHPYTRSFDVMDDERGIPIVDYLMQTYGGMYTSLDEVNIDLLIDNLIEEKMGIEPQKLYRTDIPADKKNDARQMLIQNKNAIKKDLEWSFDNIPKLE